MTLNIWQCSWDAIVGRMAAPSHSPHVSTLKIRQIQLGPMGANFPRLLMRGAVERLVFLLECPMSKACNDVQESDGNPPGFKLTPMVFLLLGL